MARQFGEIEGHPEGAVFDSREALSKAGVHRPTMAGISGTADEAADSVVLSGGYEDDFDYGDEVVYTGHGGRDPNTAYGQKTQTS
jgi:putative restriction endonuclease